MWGQKIAQQQSAKHSCFNAVTRTPHAYHPANNFAFLGKIVQLFGDYGATSVTYLPFSHF
jgi:uncharacterized protein with NAD-binding domain and iron-sulfur cluster